MICTCTLQLILAINLADKELIGSGEGHFHINVTVACVPGEVARGGVGTDNPGHLLGGSSAEDDITAIPGHGVVVSRVSTCFRLGLGNHLD